MKNMKTLRVKMVGLLATALILFSAFRADKPVITIFMIGDSTMANKKIDGGNPERGWGMVLPGFFSEDIRIDNHAANGRSSKSFISEGRWEKVISKVKKGDYVFIQFGHNDEKADSTRHTDPGSTFDENLRRYVNETRAKGGIPVLFNSIVRQISYSRRMMPSQKMSAAHQGKRNNRKKELFYSIRMAPIWILPAMWQKNWE